MNRILLLLDHKENRRLLAEELGTRYEVMEAGSEEDLAAPFDLGILDGPALDRLWAPVQARKASEQPHFLPFLLVTSRADVGMATRHLWKVVDELILAPIERVELQARVANLFNARGFSAELERRVAERTAELLVANQKLSAERQAALEARNKIEHINQALEHEIAERQQAEDEIRKLNAELELRVARRTCELEAANKELETFTYSVSHDLKAPLRGIDGYSHLLLEDHSGSLNEEGRQFLRNIRRGVAQMNQLIDDLLAYSRMERQDLHSRPVDLAALVQEILAERQAGLDDKGVQLELDVPPVTVQADRNGLALVLRNLFDNAVKFSASRQPPLIGIRGEVREKSVILIITDNGIGFDMAFHERIFALFQRLQRNEDYPGTGIGLAIVARAMQRMGGRVWAESTPGEGASFYLELPR